MAFSVVRSDEHIFEELLKSLTKTKATQVFVTGPEASRILRDKVDSVSIALRQTWMILPSEYTPTQANMHSLMEKFALMIDSDPSQRRLCFGPSSPERLLQYLFKPSKNGFYQAGLYILGLYDPPVSNLRQFGKAVNAEDKAPGFIELIISAEDRLLLIQEQEELQTLLEQSADVSDKLWKIMTSRQEQVEAEEKLLRVPFPSEKVIDLITLPEAERRKQGLLPPPQNIGFNYKCECGVYLSVDLKNFNVFDGVQVECADCSAVCFVPPEILDHTKYDPSRKGATLKGDYQTLLRFVRHRL